MVNLSECAHSNSPELVRVYAQQQPWSCQSVCTATALNLSECMHSNSPELVRVYAQQQPSTYPLSLCVHGTSPVLVRMYLHSCTPLDAGTPQLQCKLPQCDVIAATACHSEHAQRLTKISQCAASALQSCSFSHARGGCHATVNRTCCAAEHNSVLLIWCHSNCCACCACCACCGSSTIATPEHCILT